MENQEIDVITFFYERGNSKADYLRKEWAHIVIPKESAHIVIPKESAHIVIPKVVGLRKLKRIFT